MKRVLFLVVPCLISFNLSHLFAQNEVINQFKENQDHLEKLGIERWRSIDLSAFPIEKLDSMVQYNIDSTAGTQKYSQKTIFEYENNFKRYISYNYQTNSAYTKNIDDYDDNGLIVENNSFKFDTVTTKLIPTSRRTYEYDQTGKSIRSTAYLWNSTTNNWDPQNKNENNYNTKNLLFQRAFFLYDATKSKFIGQSMQQYTYDVQNNNIEILDHKFNTSNETWSVLGKTVSLFDSNNDETQRDVYKLSTTKIDSFYIINRIQNKYDKPHLVIEQTTIFFNNTFPKGRNQYLVTNEYNPAGNLLYTKTQRWTTADIWEDYFQVICLYDTNENRVFEESYEYNPSTKIWRRIENYINIFDNTRKAEDIYGNLYKINLYHYKLVVHSRGYDFNIGRLSTTDNYYYSSISTDTDDQLSSKIKFYPNPVKEKLFIENNTQLPIQEITIFNEAGQVIERIQNPSFPINFKQKTMGIYYIQIRQNNKISQVKMIKTN